MRTDSFDFLRGELNQILRGIPMEQNLNAPVALDLNRYAGMDDAEIARQLRIAIAAAEGKVVQQVAPAISPRVVLNEIELPKQISRLQWIMSRRPRGFKW